MVIKGYYPNVDKEDSKSHLSLFLHLNEAKNKKFKIDYKFGIKDKTKDKSKMLATFNIKGEEFNEINEGWGRSKLFSWIELFNPVDRFITDGKITFICELMISQHEPGKKKKSRLGFETLFDDDFLADFELATNDKKVLKAHKVVLALRSRVFHAMLKNDTKEVKTGVVEIPDFDSKVMTEILRIIYTNKVDGLKEIAQDLIFAAEKYELDDLKETCIDSLIESLTTENVWQLLVVSDRVSKAERFFEKCSDFIIINYETVSKNKDWKDLPTDCSKKLMDQMMKRLSCSSIIEIQ